MLNDGDHWSGCFEEISLHRILDDFKSSHVQNSLHYLKLTFRRLIFAICISVESLMRHTFPWGHSSLFVFASSAHREYVKWVRFKKQYVSITIVFLPDRTFFFSHKPINKGKQTSHIIIDAQSSPNRKEIQTS